MCYPLSPSLVPLPLSRSEFPATGAVIPAPLSSVRLDTHTPETLSPLAYSRPPPCTAAVRRSWVTALAASNAELGNGIIIIFNSGIIVS
ncbi:hypothetical protein Hanom_Chr10g00874801 [Helianthus anomalus]